MLPVVRRIEAHGIGAFEEVQHPASGSVLCSGGVLLRDSFAGRRRSTPPPRLPSSLVASMVAARKAVVEYWPTGGIRSLICLAALSLTFRISTLTPEALPTIVPSG